MAHTREVEIERNYGAFLGLLGELMRHDEGRYALLRNCRLEGVFDTPGEAVRGGFARFGDHDFSIQLITDKPVDLGFYSHALPAG
jgi:hypothetical protein